MINFTIFIPIIIQLFFGTFIIFKNKYLSLQKLTSINFLLQIIISVLLIIHYHNLIQKNSTRCYNSMLGIIGLVFICFIFLFLIFIIQLIIKYFYNRKIKSKYLKT